MYTPGCDKKMLIICKSFGLDPKIMDLSSRVSMRNNYKLGVVKRSYSIKGKLTGKLTELADQLKPLGFRLFSFNETPMFLYTAVDGRAIANKRRCSKKIDINLLDVKARHFDENITPAPPTKKQAVEKTTKAQYTLDDAIINEIADRVVEKLLAVPFRRFIGL